MAAVDPNHLDRHHMERAVVILVGPYTVVSVHNDGLRSQLCHDQGPHARYTYGMDDSFRLPRVCYLDVSSCVLLELAEETETETEPPLFFDLFVWNASKAETFEWTVCVCSHPSLPVAD